MEDVRCLRPRGSLAKRAKGPADKSAANKADQAFLDRMAFSLLCYASDLLDEEARRGLDEVIAKVKKRVQRRAKRRRK